MEPISRTVPALQAPTGNPITRGLRAIVMERRIPSTLEAHIDRLLRRFGRHHEPRRVRDQIITFRRCATDEEFVANVLVDQEYFRPGYAPASGEVVVDVGANIGTFTLASAARMGGEGRIIAVEPF